VAPPDVAPHDVRHSRSDQTVLDEEGEELLLRGAPQAAEGVVVVAELELQHLLGVRGDGGGGGRPIHGLHPLPRALPGHTPHPDAEVGGHQVHEGEAGHLAELLHDHLRINKEEVHLQEGEQRPHDRVREHHLLGTGAAHRRVHRDLEPVEDERHQPEHEGAYTEVEGRPGGLGPGDVGASQGPEGGDRPHLGVLLGEVLLAGADGGTVLQDDGGVDGQDGEDGAHVQVQQEHALEVEGQHAVVQHLSDAEGHHQQHDQLTVHARQHAPQVHVRFLEAPVAASSPQLEVSLPQHPICEESRVQVSSFLRRTPRLAF